MKPLVFFLFFLVFSFPALPALGQGSGMDQLSREDSLLVAKIENSLTPVFILDGVTYEKGIPQMMREEGIPGVSIAFVDKGRIAWTRCYGVRDREKGVPVTPQTVFLSASLSKPVSAIAALRLVERGLLQLDEDVNRKLKGWKVPHSKYTAQEKVTLRRLIGHTAGLTEKDRIFLGYAPGEKLPTVEQILKGEKPSKDSAVYVASVPGSQRSYSNAGYLVLQELITDITGKAFSRLMDEEVLQRCGMSRSSFRQPLPEALLEARATGYSANGSPMPYHLYPFMAPAALWSTPTDLARFMGTLLKDAKGDHKLLSPAMMQQVLAKKDERLGFSKIFYGEDVLFRHTGSNDGFTSYMAGSVSKDQALVIMTNSETGFPLLEAILRSVARAYGWEYLKPEVLERFEGPTVYFYQLVGRFATDSDTYEFKVVNDRMHVRTGGTEFEELIRVEESAFLLPAGPVKFVFVRGSDGLVSEVRVTNERADYLVAKKIP